MGDAWFGSRNGIVKDREGFGLFEKQRELPRWSGRSVYVASSAVSTFVSSEIYSSELR